MYQPSKKPLVLFVIFVFLLAGCESSGKSEEILSTEQKENTSFSVKVTAVRERRFFGQLLAGASYIFEVKNKAEQGWRRFMVVNHDDPIPIDKNSIVLVNESIGYVFMVKIFAVTTDGGLTWSIWNINKVNDLKDDLSCRIQTIKIVENGTGSLDIKCSKAERVLSTNDYGVTWK